MNILVDQKIEKLIKELDDLDIEIHQNSVKMLKLTARKMTAAKEKTNKQTALEELRNLKRDNNDFRLSSGYKPV